MKTHTFHNGSIFIVFHERKCCLSVLNDGKIIPALVQPGQEGTAKECGYTDTWSLVWEHEFCHNYLADRKGLSESYTFRYVASGGKEPTDETKREEAEVLDIQKKLNSGEGFSELRQLLNNLR